MSVLQATSVQVFEDQWITWSRKPNGRLPSGCTALEAVIEARAQGLVGVTGHGTQVAADASCAIVRERGRLAEVGLG